MGARLIRLGAWLIRLLLATLGRTYRVQLVRGGEHLDAVIAEKRPVLISFWHNRAYLAAGFLYHRVLPRGLDVTVLASKSRDGELVAKVAEQWGLSVIRGSSSRGGLEALRALHKGIVRHGTSPIMIPDGPTGPLYHFKAGAAVLAQTSGAPILPMGLAAQRFFTVKSWDRLIVPWPFSRVAITVGEPQALPKRLATEELEAERRRLEGLLDDLTLEAEACLGVTDALG